jgi:hypothetical protein
MRNRARCAVRNHIDDCGLPPAIHTVLVELARPVARVRVVWHDAVHADAVFVAVVACHVRPVPLERHGHLPQVLRYVVKGLVELAHGHRIEVVVDAVDVGAGSHGQSAVLLHHLRCH